MKTFLLYWATGHELLCKPGSHFFVMDVKKHTEIYTFLFEPFIQFCGHFVYPDKSFISYTNDVNNDF